MLRPASASAELLDPARYGPLYLVRPARDGPLARLHSSCWVAGRRYRVVGFLDLGDGQGPQICVVPWEAHQAGFISE